MSSLSAIASIGNSGGGIIGRVVTKFYLWTAFPHRWFSPRGEMGRSSARRVTDHHTITPPLLSRLAR
jgi:hypothetical protein